MSVFTAPAATTDTLAATAGGDGLARALNALDDKVGALVTTDITDITATAAELNIMDGVTSTAAELNILDGVTADKDELNHNDGLTSATVGLTDTQTLTNKTLTSPTFGGTPVLDSDSAVPFYNDSMARQAIINGNFDVWGRGTSIAMTTANAYAPDRWYCETATAATDKTVSRQTASNNGSYYSCRVAVVEDVDELVTFSQALESQDSIKFRGSKLTLSFWAKAGAEFVSDNATLVCKIVTGKGADQKVLAFTTSADAISANKTLTTSWAKHTITTTAVIAADITQVGISFAFTHAGAGVTTNYFELSQVQLCVGLIALPFQPKSYAQELADCQRYYFNSRAGSVQSPSNMGVATSTSRIATNAHFPTEMRKVPTITPYSYAATANKVSVFAGADDVGTTVTAAANQISRFGFISIADSATGFTAAVVYWFYFIADAEF